MAKQRRRAALFYNGGFPALTLKNHDGHRRYKIGKIILTTNQSEKLK